MSVIKRLSFIGSRDRDNKLGTEIFFARVIKLCKSNMKNKFLSCSELCCC